MFTGESVMHGTFSSWHTAVMAIEDGVRAGADQHVDFVLFDQLAGVARGGRRVGRVVELNQIELDAVDLVLVGDAGRHPLGIGNADRGARTGHGGDEADIDVGCVRRQRQDASQSGAADDRAAEVTKNPAHGNLPVAPLSPTTIRLATAPTKHEKTLGLKQ